MVKIYFVMFFILCSSLFVQAQEIMLKGKVVDALNASLMGASVMVKGSKNATITNQQGEFSLKSPAKFPFTLQVRSVGYLTQELVLKSQDFVTINLQESTNQLDEVVVSSGYMIQKKAEFSGSVSAISAKQLQNRPATSFDQLLGGQATGIDIIQPSSILNSTPVIRVRGINTITSGLFPLVVVDGVTVFVGAIGGLIGNNPLADINPNDIQSIDVLKDASAAAIYGSRAANGVMVITTKKGKIGKPKVSYDTWVSRATPYNLPELLGAEDYVMIKNEALQNAGKTDGFFLSKNADGSTVNTNWYDVAFRPGISHNHNVSVSGANDATSYYFSAG